MRFYVLKDKRFGKTTYASKVKKIAICQGKMSMPSIFKSAFKKSQIQFVRCKRRLQERICN